MRVLLFEECGFWVAQGLEFDIAAQGKTLSDARQIFAHVVATQILVDIANGAQPLSSVPAAPVRYLKAFDDGVPVTEPV